MTILIGLVDIVILYDVFVKRERRRIPVDIFLYPTYPPCVSASYALLLLTINWPKTDNKTRRTQNEREVAR